MALMSRIRPADLSGFHILPKRWIAERRFGWLNRYRQLSKDYERTIESSTTFIRVAIIALMVRRLTTS
jgi:transposase